MLDGEWWLRICVRRVNFFLGIFFLKLTNNVDELTLKIYWGKPFEAKKGAKFSNYADKMTHIVQERRSSKFISQ